MGTRPKQYEIIKASKRSKDIKGIFAGGQRLKFGSSGGFITSDVGIAREVEQKYGSEGSKDCVVVEIDDADPSAENRGGRRTRKTYVINAPWKDE